MMEFEVRHWMTNSEAGIEDRQHNGIGNLFYGSKDTWRWIATFPTRAGWREQAPVRRAARAATILPIGSRPFARANGNAAL